MSATTATLTPAAAVERHRLGLAARLAADEGLGWADGFGPGTLGCHELLDRVALIQGLVSDKIAEHPACVANPEWFALAEQATAALARLYQKVGAA